VTSCVLTYVLTHLIILILRLILRTFTQHRAKPVSVNNEDDILHLTNEELPTFGGVLSPADSERFLQFFTVPYLRIPLILDFFANGDPGT
jgi:hypothetical protein